MMCCVQPDGSAIVARHGLNHAARPPLPYPQAACQLNNKLIHPDPASRAAASFLLALKFGPAYAQAFCCDAGGPDQ